MSVAFKYGQGNDPHHTNLSTFSFLDKILKSNLFYEVFEILTWFYRKSNESSIKCFENSDFANILKKPYYFGAVVIRYLPFRKIIQKTE